jgi:hypothetical protein
MRSSSQRWRVSGTEWTNSAGVSRMLVVALTRNTHERVVLRAAGLGPRELVFESDACELRSRADPEFAVDVAQVHADGVGRDE